MNPIFTISNTNNLDGYWYDEFTSRFEGICEEHINNGRAKKFAFILYDFHSPTHDVLQNTGAFVDLDRLSGKDITIFYLDGQHNEQITTQNRFYKNLNHVFLSLCNKKIQSIPFIMFFDFIAGDIENFTCYSIRNDEKFILNDLTKAINKELKTVQKREEKTENKSMFGTLIKETPKIIYTEFLKLIMKDVYDPN